MIEAVAFDLDDTLIDTSGLLVPAAARGACEAMMAAGLACDLEKCLEWRAELAPNLSHKEMFRVIAERAGAGDAASLGEVGSRKFYNSTVPSPLPLLKGAEGVLAHLSGRLPLFLVTSGAPETQWRKIRACGLENRFDAIYVIDKFKNENKTLAFEKILARRKLAPSALLSVGNRLREEIRLAKRLGARTCYFEYGEHLGETPEGPEDVPDHRVRSWKEFLAECRL